MQPELRRNVLFTGTLGRTSAEIARERHLLTRPVLGAPAPIKIVP